MKGIYYSEGLDFSGTENVGIEHKVLNEIKYLKSFSELVVINTVFQKTIKEKIVFLLPGLKSCREKNREVLFEKMNNKINYIYIRKPSLTVNFYKILKNIKANYPDVCIYLEIPTYPFYNEYVGIARLMIIKSKRCESKLKKVVDRIITYSDDKMIWGIPTINMSNCVVYDDIPMRGDGYTILPNTIRLTCVARFMYWHGLDRLICGMKKYNGSYKIILNVVGGGPEIEKLKLLASGMNNVIFHGSKSGSELDRIFNKTDIAIDALGRHRSGVYYNSSLKGKEYLARGLPIVSAVKTELDYIDDYKYYLRVPADDSCIDVEKIVEFYDTIYSKEDASMITKKIRNSTKKLFDYEYGFKEIMKREIEDAQKKKL